MKKREKRNMKNMKKKSNYKGEISMKKIISMLMALTMCLTLTACNGGKKVDYSQYATFTMTGVNGHGTVSVELNGEELITEDVEKKIDEVCGEGTKNSNSLDSLFGSNLSSLFSLNKAVIAEITSDNNGTLSNGDKVTAEIGVDEVLLATSGLSKEDFLKKIGLTPKNYELTYTVEGLVDGTTIDFESVMNDHLTWTGAEDSIKASFTIDKDENTTFEQEGITFSITNYGSISSSLNIRAVKGNDYIGYVDINQYENTDGNKSKYSVGDEITFKIEPSSSFEEYAEENNIYLPETIKIKVPETGKYITSKDEVNDDVINAITSEIKTKNERLGTIDINNIYFYTVKDGVADSSSYTHKGIIVTYTHTTKYGPYTNNAILYGDIVVKDGKYLSSINPSCVDTKFGFSESTIKNIESELTSYNLEKIK